MSKIQKHHFDKVLENGENIFKLTKIGISNNALYPESDYGNKPEGFIGVLPNKPRVGENLMLLGKTVFSRDSIMTSKVTKILEVDSHLLIHTQNSIYKLEKYENITHI